jgi:hypothetical protein
MTHWLLRIGDGENFIRSSKYKIWGVSNTSSDSKHFIKNVKNGDILWFVQGKSKGKIMAVATYSSHNIRELGPLVNLSMSNEELGWNGGPDWTSEIEIHYINLYNLSDCELLTYIKSPKTIRKYDEKCKVDLAVEYNYIIKYIKVRFEFD